MSEFRYLLDTNIISHLSRDPQGVVFKRLRQLGDERVCTSIVVAAELRFGAEKRRSKRLSEWVEAVLATMDVLPLRVPVDQAYAQIRADLEQRGEIIGANDMMIAAHALSLNVVLVTDNVREFSRVQGLQVENWLVS